MLGHILKNHYRIVYELGKGAFGHVYLVEDLDYQTLPRFVVKHLQPDYRDCKSPQTKEALWQEALRLFEREAKILKKLGRCSSQIPTMEEYFDEDNQFYLVQEWIEGETLDKTEIQHGKRWTQQDTIKLLIEILEPLKFCHQEGVVHRDLKPANLMRRRNGELVIIDFGAVREISQLTLKPNAPLTRIGTVGYMPIEQFNGSPVLASDVYAVGAIGMQAMTGMYPHEVAFDADTGIFAWQQVPGCYATAAFANVLNRMLADATNARYTDAAAALAAVVPLKSTSPPTTKPFTPPAQTNSNPPVNPQPTPKFKGSLSQEIFTFETAKLQLVKEQQVEIVEKPGWLGLGKREEHQTKTVTAWKIQKTTGQTERFIEDLGNGLNLEMVYIPNGTFLMGAPVSEANSYDDERPEHLVTVPEFYMGRYAVTQAQYLAIMGKNPSYFQGAQQQLPVEQVSWHDAQEFCIKLSVKTGKKYQLPSEAMWEYACRAGTTTPFHFGEAINTDVANFDENFTFTNAAEGQHRKKTTGVGRFPANDFGLANMHGNVWEWCADHWHENYQRAQLDGDIWGGFGDQYLLRGGSWISNPSYCRSAVRSKRSANNRSKYIGFRVIHHNFERPLQKNVVSIFSKA